MTVEQVKNIWENCPKSVEKLIEWYKGQMPKPIGKPEIDIPIQEAFKHADKALQVSMSAGTPRFLYEFFDELHIHPTIETGREDEKLVWTWEIYDYVSLNIVNSLEISYTTRIEAENYALAKTFTILENKLND